MSNIDEELTEEYYIQSLKDDLDWIEKEFKILFQYKSTKTIDDITLGNKILDHFIENIKSNSSEEILNLLAITLNRIEQSYPEFF
ncbi:MAG: hypothetical protein ACFFDG_02830 [Promethearchaeota archaeon]